MPIDVPDSSSVVVQRSRVDVQRELRTSNPFLPASWLGSIIVAVADRVFDFYFALRQTLLEAMPHTAEDNLEDWAAIWGVTRLAGTTATGAIVGTGIVGNQVFNSSTFQSSDGKTYSVVGAGGTIAAYSMPIASITHSGNVATVTTNAAHELVSAFPVQISGSAVSEYNGTWTITVTSETTFTFELNGSPADDLASAASVEMDAYVRLSIVSDEAGADQNQALDTPIDLSSPLVGVDATFYATAGELAGGTSQETDDALRARYLDLLRNPVAQFNVNAIVARAKTINGVTRVWVRENTDETGSAEIGEVLIFFMRDDDTNPIPTSPEVAQVDAAIDEIRPANTAPDDVHVLAPAEVDAGGTEFTFSAISPDTTTMRTSIQARLQQFFDEETEPGVDVVEEAYNAAIYQTVDTVTGERVASFTLSTVGGVAPADITVGTLEIATLGTVSF